MSQPKSCKILPSKKKKRVRITIPLRFVINSDLSEPFFRRSTVKQGIKSKKIWGRGIWKKIRSRENWPTDYRIYYETSPRGDKHGVARFGQNKSAKSQLSDVFSESV